VFGFDCTQFTTKGAYVSADALPFRGGSASKALFYLPGDSLAAHTRALYTMYTTTNSHACIA